LRLLGTSSHIGTLHTEVDWRGRLAIVAGSEAHGLPPTAPVDEWVRIEHRGRAESINVAMAVTVLCFEAARARW
jgi:TrmH family RNA methyltransferase